MVNSPLNRMYVHVEGGALAVDLAVLVAFIVVALHSDRFWPLWVAGLQLTTSIAHFLKAIDPHLIPQAYGLAVRFWSYPILDHPRRRLVARASRVKSRPERNTAAS